MNKKHEVMMKDWGFSVNKKRLNSSDPSVEPIFEVSSLDDNRCGIIG